MHEQLQDVDAKAILIKPPTQKRSAGKPHLQRQETLINDGIIRHYFGSR